MIIIKQTLNFPSSCSCPRPLELIASFPKNYFLFGNPTELKVAMQHFHYTNQTFREAPFPRKREVKKKTIAAKLRKTKVLRFHFLGKG